MSDKDILKYNNGSLNYIICYKESSINALQNVKFKIIINYDLKRSLQFFERSTASKYVNKNDKVHMISFIDESSSKLYEIVEVDCNVVLHELPSALDKALVDDDKEVHVKRDKGVPLSAYGGIYYDY